MDNKQLPDSAAARLDSFLRLAAAYVRLNFSAQLEYRGAFLSQVIAMFINDCVWLAFWSLFFTRFPALRGWTINDVITMWGVVAAGFGIAHGICGNGLLLPTIIARGQLESWMLYPRALLPHVLLGKMNATCWGDTIFGFAAYLILVRPDLPHLALFCLLTFSAALLFIGFSIMTGSLSFFMGNSEGLAEQWRYALITFSTYPSTLFDGAAKLILFTLIPAAFVCQFPIEALRTMSLWPALAALAGSLAVLLIGTALFYWGLSRYESGNLMEMRG